MTSIAHTRECPKACASCEQHETRPCCVLLEVTTRCNLGCPVCFASAHAEGKPDDAYLAKAGTTTKRNSAGTLTPTSPLPADPTLETIAGWYASLYKRAGSCHIQLSGGEPTMRDDLADIITLGKQAGFSYFQLNTNGIKLAEEPGLAMRLKQAGLTCVFLQFDGMDDPVHIKLRGKTLQTIKQAAIDACAKAKLPVVLVPTVAGGINEHQLWPLIQYGISRSPTVRGVHIQPLAWFGRTDIQARRLTNDDVLALLAEQSDGMLKPSHFTGGGAEHPDCSFNAHYFITDAGELEPSGVQRPSCCDDEVAHAQDIQTRRWGTNLDAIPTVRPPEGTMDEFLWKTKARSFAITGMSFMDEETLDLERLRRCYLFILNEEGTPIPFCAYNSYYRSSDPRRRQS